MLINDEAVAIAALLEAIDYSVFIIKDNGEVAYVNDAAQQKLKVTVKEIKGLDFIDILKLIVFKEEEISEFEVEYAKVLRGIRVKSTYVTIDERVYRINATSFISKGEILGHAFIFDQLDCIGKKDEKIDKLQEDVLRLQSEKSAIIDEMVYNVKCSSEYIKYNAKKISNINLDLKETKEIKHIIKAANAQIRIIEDINAVSLIEDGRLEPEEIKDSLDSVVTEVVNKYKAYAGEKGIEIKYNIDKELLQEFMLPYKSLTSILSNIVEFFIRRPSNKLIGINIILVRSSKDNTKIMVKVYDSSPKFEDETLNDISNLLAKTNLNFDKIKNGSNLLFAKIHLENLGGTIWVESDRVNSFSFMIELKAGGNN